MRFVAVAVLLGATIVAQAPDPDALSQQAARLARDKRFDEAAALWNKALKIAPNHYASLFNLGYMRVSQSDFGQAEPLLRKAAKLRPDEFAPHYLLGSVLVGLGRREAGIMEWRTALRLQPANIKLIQILSVEYSNGGYFREACEAARKGLATTKDEVNVWLLAIKSCYDAQDPGALQLAKQAAERFPDSARTNFEYSFQLQRAGRAEESLPFLEKAMAVDPAYEEPFFFYGDLLLQEERYSEAIDYLKKALRNRPDYTAACVSLAKAYMGLQQYHDAVKELNGCIAEKPAHPQPHLVLSQVYFRMGEEAKAKAEKETSLRLRRADPSMMEAVLARPFPASPK